MCVISHADDSADVAVGANVDGWDESAEVFGHVVGACVLPV